jgi:hypothetical protein
MLTLTAGENYGVVASTPIEGWYNGGTGAQAVLAPIDGLSIGVTYPFAKAPSAAVAAVAQITETMYTATGSEKFDTTGMIGYIDLLYYERDPTATDPNTLDFGITGHHYMVLPATAYPLTPGRVYEKIAIAKRGDAAASTYSQFSFGNLILSASYAAKDLATVLAAYDLGTGDFWAGLNVVAVPSLTAKVDAFFYGANDAGTAGFDKNAVASCYKVEGSFGYTVAGFTPNLWVYASSIKEAYGSKPDGSATWGVKPNVSYAMGAVTPAFYFQYNADATYSLGLNAAIAVEKSTIYVYLDYANGYVSDVAATTYDLGIRYDIAF